MTQPSFDMAAQVRFDLEKGAVRGGGDEPLAVIPLSLLAAMSPADAVEAAARSFGSEKGRAMAARLSGKDIQALSDEIAGLLALMGLGKPSIEIHGDALLIRVVSGSPQGLSAAVSAVICGVLGGALESISGSAAFQVVPINDSADEAVLFAGNATAAGLLKRAVKGGGIPMEEALAALGRSGGEQ